MKINKKIVYISGCCGFMGRYVTQACLDKGYYVIGVDKGTYASDLSWVKRWETYHGDNFKFLKEDIKDLNHLYECDFFINMAAESHVDNSIAGSKVFLDTNINGVYNLLELIRQKGGHQKPTLLHFSTDEVYGDCINCAHTEMDILKPSNPYSATKAAGDHLIQAWHRTYGIPYLIVRPTNNYGIGQYMEKLIPRAIKSFNLEKKLPLHNGGLPVRNWLHAHDTAQAIMLLIEKGVVNEIYNISGDYEKTNIEIVNQILHHYLEGKDYKIEDYVDFSYSRPGQDVRYSLDDSKLRALGWSPKKKFEEEIPKIVKCYKEKFVW